MIVNHIGRQAAPWIASCIVAATFAGCDRGAKASGEALTVQELQRRVEAHAGVVVVDFWAPWCGPCRVLKPVLEKVVADYGDRASLIEVDIDVNQDLARHFEVSAIPTLIAFRGGKPVARQVGGLGDQALRAWIDQALAEGGQ